MCISSVRNLPNFHVKKPNSKSPEYVIGQFAKHRGTGTQRPQLEKVEEAANIDTRNRNLTKTVLETLHNYQTCFQEILSPLF